MTARTGGIWVFAELNGGALADVAKELLGKAAELARDMSTDVCAIVVGHAVSHAADECSSYGADRVVVVDHPLCESYRSEVYCKAVSEAVRRYEPEVFLLGATTLGRDLASAVATELSTGLTADCTSLEVDGESRLLKQTRPAFGGNVMATIICKDKRPQMATVRPKVFELPEPEQGPLAEIVTADIDLDESDARTTVLEFIPADKGNVEIETADVIISGGRGLGSPEKLGLLRELADLLGGVVGASRPVVEMGWMPYEHQVGQTGRTVRPKLYIAAGISGAVQHIAGMQHSRVIVAINSDADAPIFTVADYGIIGDVSTVLPELKHQLEHYLGGTVKKIESKEGDGDG